LISENALQSLTDLERKIFLSVHMAEYVLVSVYLHGFFLTENIVKVVASPDLNLLLRFFGLFLLEGSPLVLNCFGKYQRRIRLYLLIYSYNRLEKLILQWLFFENLKEIIAQAVIDTLMFLINLALEIKIDNLC
jgi:hypothetical protein